MDCFRLRSLSFGGHVTALAMTVEISRRSTARYMYAGLAARIPFSADRALDLRR